MIKRVYVDTIAKPVANMVQSMRQIREEISNEIKDMTFAEERAYLDKLLQSDKLKISVKEQNSSRPKR
jgi:hypothetical protein